MDCSVLSFIYRTRQLQKRIISPDSFISIDGSKYSVPAKYVGKTLQFRIIYGFRIELYDRSDALVLKMEVSQKEHDVKADPMHYAEIAVPASTSIPQIRRDFTALFSNGKRYLDAAGRKFDQPTHYARKIMLLRDLYDDATLDRFISYCIDQDKMDIKSFRSILRDYNAGKLGLPEMAADTVDAETGMSYCDDDPGLTRDCSYYETNAMSEVSQ